MANISNAFLPDNGDWQGRSPLPVTASEETLSESRECGYGARRLEVESYSPTSKHHESDYQVEQLISPFPKLQVSSAPVAGQSFDLVRAGVPWSAMRGAFSEKEQVLKTVMGILNKLTPQKFDVLKAQLINSGINSAEILLAVVSLIFNRVVLEPIFCPMYAELCRELSWALPEFLSEEPDGKPIAFRRNLLNTCQATFEGTDTLRAEIKEMTASHQESERHGKERMAKLRSLGNIRFIGELFKQRMVSEKIIHDCIQSLLGRDATVPPAEENVNSLCLLFNIVGKKLQGNPNSRSLIDSYLAQMEQLSNNQHFTSQMRFMVRGVLKIHALRRGTTSVRNGRGVPWSAMRGALSEKEQVLKTVMGILNKLTPQKFDVLKAQLINSGINSAEILLGVVSLIFNRAVLEPIFCPMYAELCRELSWALPEFLSEEPDGKPIAFRRNLLNTCQATFEGTDTLRAEIKEMTASHQESERHGKERMVKLRSLGNIRFIRELFKQRMVSEKIIHDCIQSLLGRDATVPPAEENVISLCLLFNIVGKKLQ